MQHYLLPLPLITFLCFLFLHNYNDKALHQIMHNTMSHLSNIS